MKKKFLSILFMVALFFVSGILLSGCGNDTIVMTQEMNNYVELHIGEYGGIAMPYEGAQVEKGKDYKIFIQMSRAYDPDTLVIYVNDYKVDWEIDPNYVEPEEIQGNIVNIGYFTLKNVQEDIHFTTACKEKELNFRFKLYKQENGQNQDVSLSELELMSSDEYNDTTGLYEKDYYGERKAAILKKFTPERISSQITYDLYTMIKNDYKYVSTYTKLLKDINNASMNADGSFALRLRGADYGRYKLPCLTVAPKNDSDRTSYLLNIDTLRSENGIVSALKKDNVIYLNIESIEENTFSVDTSQDYRLINYSVFVDNVKQERENYFKASDNYKVVATINTEVAAGYGVDVSQAYFVVNEKTYGNSVTITSSTAPSNLIDIIDPSNEAVLSFFRVKLKNVDMTNADVMKVNRAVSLHDNPLYADEDYYYFGVDTDGAVILKMDYRYNLNEISTKTFTITKTPKGGQSEVYLTADFDNTKLPAFVNGVGEEKNYYILSDGAIVDRVISGGIENLPADCVLIVQLQTNSSSDDDIGGYMMFSISSFVGELNISFA